MAPTGSKIRRRKRSAAAERLSHGADGGRAHERHIGERNHVGARGAGGPRRASEAGPHAVARVFAHCHLAALLLERCGQGRRTGTHYGYDAGKLGFEMAGGLHRDGYPVGQRMGELVRAEPARRARGEQHSDNIAQDVLTSGVLTSHAEASKRRAGLAAQLGSLTPWRTPVISARMATAISGGVLEPMYRPTGPRSRAISSSETSNSRSRTRRASLFFLEPMAPT